jgi:ribosomal protein S18 acetylase RimI-like enzyme
VERPTMDEYVAEPSGERQWTDRQMEELFAEGFPEFITADHEVKRYIGRVREDFTSFDLILVDGNDQPVATGWGVPLAWDGVATSLPDTFADVLRVSLEQNDRSEARDTLVICGAVVHPAHKGRGTAEQLLNALIRVAFEHDLSRVVAPVRPTRKDLYPLLDISDYVDWKRADGLPWDPWLRLHVRMGATVIGIARHAQTMTGTVAQWREWTGLEFPVSAHYVIPKGMSPLRVDLAHDVGTYEEPNVWVRHR